MAGAPARKAAPVPPSEERAPLVAASPGDRIESYVFFNGVHDVHVTRNIDTGEAHTSVA
jgi:hypothetical protein